MHRALLSLYNCYTFTLRERKGKSWDSWGDTIMASLMGGRTWGMFMRGVMDSGKSYGALGFLPLDVGIGISFFHSRALDMPNHYCVLPCFFFAPCFLA
jgi:hypothetical protein